MKQDIIEFPIGRGYASYWTVSDAIRELYANMLDKTGMNPTGINFHYDSLTGRLHISNSVEERMPIDALVLGNSNKASTDIGRFGEGMKMAYLALLREGREIITVNVDQVWLPSFRKSEKFGVETLCVEIQEKNGAFQHEVHHVLEVSPEEVRDFMETTLTFHRYVHGTDPYEIQTSKGRVLLGSTMNGHIYVGGLLVTRADMYGIGLDIQPEFAKLGRDRKSIDNEDETLVHSILAEALENDPEAMQPALGKNNQLRREIIASVGLADREIPEDALEDVVASILARRRLRDALMAPVIENIKKRMEEGARYVVSEDMPSAIIDGFGAKHFIKVPSGLQTQIRAKMELPHFATEHPEWFMSCGEAMDAIMAKDCSMETKLEELRKLAESWRPMSTYYV